MHTKNFGYTNVFRTCVILLSFTALFATVLLFSSDSHIAKAATTYTVSDNASGGDCAAFGTWDASSKTCTLTSDLVANGITIGSDGITLDGDGHSITGSVKPNTGVFLSGRQNVTIRDLVINNFSNGIELQSHSHYNKIENNVIIDCFWGIDLYTSSDFNTVIGNEVQGGFICMLMQFGSSYNKIIANRFSGGLDDGIGIILGYTNTSYNEVTGNTIENNVQGIEIDSITRYNKIYRNNFINNVHQLQEHSSAEMFLPMPIGGNYWSDNSAPDLNADGISDSSYLGDSLPWMVQNGWFGGGEDSAAPVISSVAPSGSVQTSTSVIEIDFADPVTSAGIFTSYSHVTLDGRPIDGCAISETQARCDVSALSSGGHSIGGSIWDNAGHRTDISGEFTVDYSFDTTAPGLSAPASALYFDDSVTLPVEFNDVEQSSGIDPVSAAITLNGVTSQCSITGNQTGTITCAATSLATGSYSALVSVKDLAGNAASITVDFEIKVPPLYIRANTTGGDCAYVGEWDFSTKTCTFTRDIEMPGITNAGIVISWNGITLDGNGHTVTGNPGKSGIYITGRSNVNVRNVILNQVGFGIVMQDSSNNIISGITTSPSSSGTGIYLINSNGNQILDNHVLSPAQYGIRLYASGNNLVRNNSVSAHYAAFEESDTVVSNNQVEANIFSSRGTGVPGTGINLSYSIGANITGNTIMDSNRGLSLSESYSHSNSIFNNNFVNNDIQVYSYGTLSTPLGGNYWSNYNEAAEGCFDVNSDGFCDAPFVFTGGQDDNPWTARNGWANGTAGKPSLSLSSPNPFWASYADYMARELSVNMTITNTGGNDAYGVQITGMSSTEGVTPATALPHAVGDFAGSVEASSICTLKYHVPAGVAIFRTTTAASAQDGAGTSYSYP